MCKRGRRTSVVEMLERRVLLDAVPVGAEFRVNTWTTNWQSRPSAAMDANGNFVVAWMSNGQDGSRYGVFAQLYDGMGIAQGNEFRVNSWTTGDQWYPSVAMDADGDFVVAWEGAGTTGYGVHARRYNAAGVPQSGEFQVNAWTGYHRGPSVAMHADGGFVIAWHGPDGSDVGVFAQRYDAAGVPQGQHFQVNTWTTHWQAYPSVAVGSNGSFVVAWLSHIQDGHGIGVYAQRYNATGVPQGGEFRVNSWTTGDQRRPSAAMHIDGSFVIAWESLAQDGSGDGVYAQRYDAAGMPQGSEFRVNTWTTGSQGHASVAMDGDGNFAIAWMSPQDGFYEGVYVQRFNADGVPQGEEFRVNTWTTNLQGYPSIAMDASGDFVIAWESNGQDGSGGGIYAQRYTVTPAPRVDDSAFRFAAAPHQLQFRFSTDVSASLGPEDLVVENLSTTPTQTLPASHLSVSYDAVTNVATFTYLGGAIPGVLADGNYRATLLAAGITNPAGTPMPADHVFDFFFLNGDATRDGVVNLADFNRLAANFGQSGPGIDFTKGDFNYDGTVNLADFNILAGRFGTVLSLPSFAGRGIAGPSPFADGTTGESERDSDEILV